MAVIKELNADLVHQANYNSMGGKRAAIKADHAEDGFIFQMFRDELNNHEYNWTGDVSDTLEALGLTLEEIESNPALLAGFNKAKECCA